MTMQNSVSKRNALTERESTAFLLFGAMPACIQREAGRWGLQGAGFTGAVPCLNCIQSDTSNSENNRN